MDNNYDEMDKMSIAEQKQAVQERVQELLKEGGREALIAEKERIAKDLGLNEADVAEFRLMRRCYEWVGGSDATPPELIRSTDHATTLFHHFIADEAEGTEDEFGSFAEAFGIAVLMGMAIGIELQERRHA